MKKILILCITATIGFACVCAGEISEAFQSFSQSVTSSVNSQTNTIKNKNIEEIKKSVSLLTEENKLLKQLVAAESQLSLRRESLIFELEKKIKLMK